MAGQRAMLFALGGSERAVWNYARVANLKGVTTITDLINDLKPATVAAFRRHSPLAALLLAPYLLWVAYAAALTAAIWWLNG